MRFLEGRQIDMTKPFILAFCAAAFLATAASAQTTPAQPDKQNGCPGAHNNMLPAIRPGEKPTGCAANTPANTASPAVDATAPDQAKPGTQTRPSGNTTTMHTPGSENSQDQGPSGAPKA
jgi:hypothetical protein